MSLPKSVDQDPLLAFAIESGTTSASSESAPHPVEPVVAAAVPPSAPGAADARAAIGALRSRVDALEKTIERSLKDTNRLKADIATLVTVTGDIKTQLARARVRQPPIVGRTSHGVTRTMSIFAAVALGVVAGAWFWINTANHPIAPPRPPGIAAASTLAAPASEVEPSAEPVTAPGPPVAQAAIVPVAAVTPVHRAREANIRPSREPALYVGTLTIDSDPAGKVLVDRKSAGETPVRLTNLKAGSHLIWIERDGYRRFTRVVQVPSDRVTRLVADLEPAAQR